MRPSRPEHLRLAAIALTAAALLAAHSARAPLASAQGAPADSAPREVVVRIGVRAKIAVILEDFTAEEPGEAADHARRMKEIVERDLEYSGIFDVKAALGAGASMAEQAGRPVGECVVSGVVARGGRPFELRGSLTDPRSGRNIARKSYAFDAAGVVETAHRYADEIIFLLTGEQGVTRTRIVFAGKTREGQDLYTVDYDGENLTRLTHDKSIVISPDWSPDGGAILYTSFKRGTQGLFWIRPDGAEGGVVTQFPGLNSAPSWASDGKRIALSLSKDGNPEIYTMRRDGTSLTRLTRGEAIDTSPSWSPTGRQIVFTSDRTGSPQLFVMEADGSNPRRATFVGDYNASPAWSPDGQSIIYVSRTDTGFDLYLLDPVTQRSTALTRGGGLYEDPCWAPDGRHIVAAKSRGGVRSLVVMNVDGSEERVIPTSGIDAFSPSWSPRPK